MLTTQEIAYGQQKNREYIYEECKAKSFEMFKCYNWEFIDSRYEFLCKQSNITPW